MQWSGKRSKPAIEMLTATDSAKAAKSLSPSSVERKMKRSALQDEQQHDDDDNDDYMSMSFTTNEAAEKATLTYSAKRRKEIEDQRRRGTVLSNKDRGTFGVSAAYSHYLPYK